MCQLGGSQEETAHLGIEVTEITGSLGLDVFWRAQNGVHIYADFVNAYVFTSYFIQHPSQKVHTLLVSGLWCVLSFFFLFFFII